MRKVRVENLVLKLIHIWFSCFMVILNLDFAFESSFHYIGNDVFVDVAIAVDYTLKYLKIIHLK